MIDEAPVATMERPESPEQLVEDRLVGEKDESEYMLRWNDHNASLISVFHQLCQDNQFTDVTLATETESFQAHKLILSACSPYFKKLFTQNPCKHPIIFLKDIPESHMKLLLEYMYRGSISVKQHELKEILHTASCLKIRGLTTAEPPAYDSDITPPLIVDERCDNGPDKFQNLDTVSNKSGDSGRSGSTSRKAEGRKSSAPKKLRRSSDHDSAISSPRYLTNMSDKSDRISPLEEIRRSTSVSPPSDDIAVSEEEDLPEDDRPVDFSTKMDNAMNSGQYSILGNYLKAGHSASPNNPRSQFENMKHAELLAAAALAGGWGMNPLAALQQRAPRPASRDSRGDSREERDDGRDEMDEENADQKLSLKQSMGMADMDMAARMRSHMFANLPTQAALSANMSNLAWLNAGKQSPPSSVMDQMDVKHMSKMDKHPLGGIKTGEIGANGKPAVACEVCGKKLADPSSLYRHRKIHSGDKPHKCPYCPRRFIQRYNMKQHIKTHRIELLNDGNRILGDDYGSAEDGQEEVQEAPMSLKNMAPFMEERGLNMTQ